MTQRNFQIAVGIIGLAFAIAFAAIVIPPLSHKPDIIGAFAAGFVNPYSSGYAIDAISCWLILCTWVIYEAKSYGIKHGWLALLLGIVPGVATGFAFYLILRTNQKHH